MRNCIITFLLVFVGNMAHAYRIEYGRTVTITRPVYENLYLAGGTVTINAPVYGDLIVAGGNIFINDTIHNDLLLAGGQVHMNGVVDDDVRCAGGQLEIARNIGGELVITGGTITITQDVVIGHGLISSGGNLVINGTIKGPVTCTAGTVDFNGVALNGFTIHSTDLAINGSISGPTVLAAQKITIGNNTIFNNDIRYWSRQKNLDFKQSLKNARAVYDPSLRIKSNEWYFLGSSTLFGLLWYLGMVFILILLIQYLFSTTFQKAGNTVSNAGLKSLGLGIAFFVGLPVAVVILFITLIGVPVGLLLLISYIGIVLLATIITAVVAANWYNNRFQYNWGYWGICGSAMAIFILLKLITFTPFFGWLLMVLMASIAIGSLLINVDWTNRHRRIATQ